MPSDNPFDTPLPSETGQQGNSAPTATADSGNPFDTPLPSEKQSQQTPEDPRAGFGVGLAKGALQTVNTVSGLLNKIPGIGETLAPSQGVSSANTIATPTTSAQKLGVTAESLLEMLSGDAGLQAASLPEKIASIAKVAKTYEEASPYVKAAIEGTLRGGITSGGETLAKTGSPTKALEAGGVGALGGAVLGPIASKVADTVGGAFANVPEETESKIVQAIGDHAESNGLVRPDAETAKDAVSDLADQYKTRAKAAYDTVDDAVGGGFKDLRDLISNQRQAVAVQKTLDPTKASEIAKDLADNERKMQDLLSQHPEAADSVAGADADWTRYKALQRVQGKVNAASGLADDSLADVNKLGSGIKALGNTMKKGAPVDMLQRAFGDDAGTIRQIADDAVGAQAKQTSQRAALKSVGGHAAGVAGLGGAAYLLHLFSSK